MRSRRRLPKKSRSATPPPFDIADIQEPPPDGGARVPGAAGRHANRRGPEPLSPHRTAVWKRVRARDHGRASAEPGCAASGETPEFAQVLRELRAAPASHRDAARAGDGEKTQFGKIIAARAHQEIHHREEALFRGTKR